MLRKLFEFSGSQKVMEKNLILHRRRGGGVGNGEGLGRGRERERGGEGERRGTPKRLRPLSGTFPKIKVFLTGKSCQNFERPG